MNIYALNLMLDQNHCSNKNLADSLGISRSSLYRKMSGQTEFTCCEIGIIRRLLKLSDEALVEIFFRLPPS